jgi:hypothetical protein
MMPKISSVGCSLKPFKPAKIDWFNGLGFGVAGTFGNESNSTISTYKTWGQSTWFSHNSGVTAAGQHAPGSAGLLLLSPARIDGRVLARSPVAQSNQQERQSHRRIHQYWLLPAGIVLLTGENASYGAVSPIRPFQLGEEGGLGAWALAARISNVANDIRQFQLGFADPGVSAKSATEYAGPQLDFEQQYQVHGRLCAHQFLARRRNGDGADKSARGKFVRIPVADCVLSTTARQADSEPSSS